jgi:hypothetical protein
VGSRHKRAEFRVYGKVRAHADTVFLTARDSGGSLQTRRNRCRCRRHRHHHHRVRASSPLQLTAERRFIAGRRAHRQWIALPHTLFVCLYVCMYGLYAGARRGALVNDAGRCLYANERSRVLIVVKELNGFLYLNRF